MYKIPLVKPHLPLLEEMENDLREMLASGRLTNFGPFSQKLEQKFCELTGARYALSVSNATTGLLLLLNTLPKGSEVLVPSFTFLPTVQAILWNSLVPVFVDIDRHSYTVAPDAVASKITSNTSALLAVHVFGNPCAIDALENISRSMGISLFFDSAHAFGARHSGKYLGTFGDAEVFSLSATKTLPCGEGGMITTNDPHIYQAMLDRRNYGFKTNSRDCENMGLNGKISEFSAILGVREIDCIDLQIHKRNRIAMLYREALQDLPGIEFQHIEATDISSYKDFTIAIDPNLYGIDRNILKRELSKLSIETESYFSPAVHQMKYFKSESYTVTKLNNTELVESMILSLPIYSDLKSDEIDCVIAAIKEFCVGDKKLRKNKGERTKGSKLQVSKI
jgi:dTDP-4-amino-4,6-dideoxygalactose transaminase